MAKFYQHLDALARCQLQTLQESGLSQRQIAERIGCSQSTVSRELSRNGRAGGYDCREAQARSEARRSQASSKPRKMVEERWAEVRERLWWGWSPQQVAGRLARDGIVSASATWIYRYVWADREAGGELFRLLRRRGKKANRRGRDGSGRGVIPGRVDISERPSIVEGCGPLLDKSGNVIGISKSGRSRDGSLWLNFFIPINEALSAIGVRLE